MVEGIRELVERVEPDQTRSDRIVQVLVDAGFDDASDVACVTPRMAARFFGDDTVLLESFQRAVVAAGAILEGWVANIGFEVRALGAAAGEGSVPGRAPPPLGPCPGRASRKLSPTVGPVGAGGEASGTSTKIVRATRLIQGFTKNLLRTKNPSPPAPSPSPSQLSLAEIGPPGKFWFARQWRTFWAWCARRRHRRSC